MVYCFECPVCEAKKDVVRPVRDHALPEVCDCGHPMRRDHQTEHTGVRGNYNKPIISTSMAFDSRDVAEHRRVHPNIDLKIDGQTAHPILRSLSQKQKYVRARGRVDTSSFT